MLKTSVIDIKHLILLHYFVQLQFYVSVEWIDVICKKQRNRKKDQKRKHAKYRAECLLSDITNHIPKRNKAQHAKIQNENQTENGFKYVHSSMPVTPLYESGNDSSLYTQIYFQYPFHIYTISISYPAFCVYRATSNEECCGRRNASPTVETGETLSNQRVSPP